MKDMQRVKNQKLNDLEEEEQENREYLQKRANQMRQEQEDEIKYLNEVCLYSLKFLCMVISISERSYMPGSFPKGEPQLDLDT